MILLSPSLFMGEGFGVGVKVVFQQTQIGRLYYYLDLCDRGSRSARVQRCAQTDFPSILFDKPRRSCDEKAYYFL